MLNKKRQDWHLCSKLQLVSWFHPPFFWTRVSCTPRCTHQRANTSLPNSQQPSVDGWTTSTACSIPSPSSAEGRSSCHNGNTWLGFADQKGGEPNLEGITSIFFFNNHQTFPSGAKWEANLTQSSKTNSSQSKAAV